jgi:PAS domain S-box-containing protein/putative nucleotidyltransferase with HDIG domain
MNSDPTTAMILDAMDDHIALLDTDGTIIYVNAAWRRFAQENGDPSLRSTGPGTNYLAVCARAAQSGDRIAQSILNGIQAVLSDVQADFQIEYPCHSPRERRWFAMHTVRLAPDDRRALVSHRLITAFKESEIRGGETIEALSQTEAVAHVGSWRWDFATNRVIWSDEMFRIFGIAPASFDGDLDTIIAQAIHPDDRERVCAANAHVISAHELAPLEYRIRRPSGEERVVYADGQLVRDDEGQPVAILGSLHDRTELKRVDSRLRLLSVALEAAATPIVITDHTGMIEWVNPAYTQMTGYTATEAIGNNPRILKSGKHPPSFYANMWETILAGEVWHSELINRRKDGQLYDEEETITPVRNAGGQITHFIAIKQDISERKQWEYEQLARTTLSTELGAAATRTDMLTIMLRRTYDLLTATGGGIAVASISSDELRIELADGIWRTYLGQRLSSFSSRIGESLANNRPFFQAMTPEDRSRALIDSLPALACVPLNVNHSPFGVLLVGREEPFSAAEQHMLLAVAEIAGNALHRATLHEETAHHLQRMQSLHRIDKAISAGVDMDIVLSIVLDEVMAQLTMDAIAVLRMHHTLPTLERVAARGFLSHHWPQTIRLGEGYAGQAALKREPVYIPDLTALEAENGGVLKEERFVVYYGIPLISKGQLRGVLELFARVPFHSSADWRTTLDMFASQLAIALDNADMVERLQRSHTELMHAYETTIEGWSRALDLRDKETEGHTLRVTELTLRLAHTMGVSDDDLVHIRRGALLHDIGKMGVPDQILLKPGPLTDAEWEIMRKHPVYAYEMLAPIAFLDQALAIPYCHHERYDGKGYPRGLKGEQIPLAARIFAVVDVWDALRSNRPYRVGWPEDRVRALIQERAGSHFDPRIVGVFLDLVGQGADLPTLRA